MCLGVPGQILVIVDQDNALLDADEAARTLQLLAELPR